jgi:hypothetical protein
VRDARGSTRPRARRALRAPARPSSSRPGSGSPRLIAPSAATCTGGAARTRCARGSPPAWSARPAAPADPRRPVRRLGAAALPRAPAELRRQAARLRRRQAPAGRSAHHAADVSRPDRGAGRRLRPSARVLPLRAGAMKRGLALALLALTLTTAGCGASSSATPPITVGAARTFQIARFQLADAVAGARRTSPSPSTSPRARRSRATAPDPARTRASTSSSCAPTWARSSTGTRRWGLTGRSTTR